VSSALALALALAAPAAAAEPTADSQPVPSDRPVEDRQPVPSDIQPVPSASPVSDRQPVPSASQPVPSASQPVPSDSQPVPPASPAAAASARLPVGRPEDARRLRRARYAEAAAFDLVGGGARRRGAWAAAVQLGYPWFGLRAQVGVLPRLAVLAEVETALARRWRPALGIGLRWVDRPHLRLSGELLLGWLIQGEPLDRRGPNAEARLRLAVPVGRVAPYLTLGTQHTVLADRTRVIRESGTTTDWSARHEWTLKASLGLAVVINHRVGLEFGVDLAWVDAPRSIGIPGLHLGVLFGGSPRGAL